MKTLLLNLFFDSVIQLSARSTVNDKAYCIRVHITFFNKLCNTTYSLYTSSGTVTDQNRCLHGRKYSPADVLHTSFVINYDIRIIILVFGKLGLKKSIYKTVAAFSLGSAHNQKIKIIIFYQSILKTSFSVIRLGHSRRDRILACKLCAGNFFPYITKCSLHFYSKNFVQI